MRFVIVFMFISLFGVKANAQYAEDWQWILSYNTAFSMGDTKDFGGSSSFRGAGFEGRYFMTDMWTVGFSAGWNVFNNKTGDVINLALTGDGGERVPVDVSGTQFRYINAWPLLVTTHYYFGDLIRPYVGLGAGAYIIENRVELGLFAATESRWHFGVAPEIGVVVPAGSIGMALGVRYNHAFKSGGTFNLDTSYIGVNLGIAY